MALPDRQNPFLQARKHARAKHAIESRFEQEKQKQRIKQAEYKRDLHELIEQLSKQRDLYKDKVLAIQHEQDLLEKQRIEALDKYEVYKAAAEAGKGVFRDKWKDDAVYGLSRPVEAPPVIPDYDQLPTQHSVQKRTDPLVTSPSSSFDPTALKRHQEKQVKALKDDTSTS